MKMKVLIFAASIIFYGYLVFYLRLIVIYMNFTAFTGVLHKQHHGIYPRR